MKAKQKRIVNIRFIIGLYALNVHDLGRAGLAI
jgi:hypothetical protein